jgi:hypothetical protein
VSTKNIFGLKTAQLRRKIAGCNFKHRAQTAEGILRSGRSRGTEQDRGPAFDSMTEVSAFFRRTCK